MLWQLKVVASRNIWRLVRREFQGTRGGITVGTIREFKLGCEGDVEGKGRDGYKREFYQQFDIDEIAQIGWFRFKEESVSNIYDFVLDLLFNIELVKPLECRSDM